MSEAKRAWLYRISVGLIPLLVAYGVVAEGTAGLWLGLAGAILGAGTSGLAAANTSTKPRPPASGTWTE